MGLILLDQGRTDEASTYFESALSQVGGSHLQMRALVVHVVALYWDAMRGDWRAWDSRMPFCSGLAQRQRFEPDIADACIKAARVCSEKGQLTRSAVAWEMAIMQFEGLDRYDRADEIRSEWARVLLETENPA